MGIYFVRFVLATFICLLGKKFKRETAPSASGIRHPASGIRHPELIMPYNKLANKGFQSPFWLFFSIASACFRLRFWQNKRERGFFRFSGRVLNLGCGDGFFAGKCCCRREVFLLLIVAAVQVPQASAQGTGAGCVIGHEMSSPYQPTIQVMNADLNAPNFTVYKPALGHTVWISYACWRYPNHYSYYLKFIQNKVYGTYYVDGDVYTIINVPGYQNQLGLIFRASGSGMSGPGAINENGGPAILIAKQAGNKSRPEASFAVGVIKLGSQPLPASLANSTINIPDVALFSTSASSSGGASALRFTLKIQAEIANPTCTTPNSFNVSLPDVYTDDFPGLYYDAGHTNFNLQFNNCSNLSKIRYRVNSVGNPPNNYAGMLPSSPDTGLAVQVKHAPNGGSLSDIHFGVWNDISTSASSYTVPMSANYYRLGNLTPGNVSASMTIAIEYQ